MDGIGREEVEGGDQEVEFEGWGEGEGKGRENGSVGRGGTEGVINVGSRAWVKRVTSRELRRSSEKKRM